MKSLDQRNQIIEYSLRLNSTNTGSSGRWGSSAFTANTFQAKHNYSCSNGDEYVYYCFGNRNGSGKFGLV